MGRAFKAVHSRGEGVLTIGSASSMAFDVELIAAYRAAPTSQVTWQVVAALAARLGPLHAA